MADPEPRANARTELITRLERPAAAASADEVSEPRTAIFRNPGFVVDATEVEAVQMSALLGGALASQCRLPAPRMRRRSGLRWGLWLGRALMGSVLVSFFLAIVALAITGVEERARSDSKSQAQLLQELLITGSLSEARSHLEKLEALVAQAKNPRAHAAIRARAEATLYRFHDADPARKGRALRLLIAEKNRMTNDAWVAAALLTSRTERASILRGGEALVLPRDADPVALAASLEAGLGRSKEARAGYLEAEAREPSHVVHLYALFSLEHVNGERRDAQLVLERMEDVSPTSPWTRLASARSQSEAAERKEAILALVDDETLPAVPRALAAENAFLDASLGLDAEHRARLLELQSSLLHRDDSFMSELPLPPRLSEGSDPATASIDGRAIGADIIATEITIEAPPATKPAKKKRTRGKRRAR